MRAAASARGEFLFFSESHVRPSSDVLERCIARMSDHPEWAALVCGMKRETTNRLGAVEADMYERDFETGATKLHWRNINDAGFLTRRSPYFKAAVVRFGNRPGRLAVMKTTTVDELRALAQGGAAILNVGARAGHREIRGAVRYRPHDVLTPQHLALPLATDKPVVLYDEDGAGDLTSQIAEKLRAGGFADVRVLQGGFAAWEGAGGATQESSIEQVVPPTSPSEVQALDRRI